LDRFLVVTFVYSIAFFTAFLPVSFYPTTIHFLLLSITFSMLQQSYNLQENDVSSIFSNSS